jgi:hypothetical protein
MDKSFKYILILLLRLDFFSNPDLEMTTFVRQRLPSLSLQASAFPLTLHLGWQLVFPNWKYILITTGP